MRRSFFNQMPFVFSHTEIPDVILIEPKVFGDDRGFLKELFKSSDFANNGLPAAFSQDVVTGSSRGVLRGMHYQREPMAQGKLVTTVCGRIFDVAADIREDSPTFGKWVSAELSAENHRMLYIPPGFCHGYCVLSDQAKLLYKMTNEYAPELEAGVVWNDSTLNIRWPVNNPIVAPRDRQLPSLSSLSRVSNPEARTQ